MKSQKKKVFIILAGAVAAAAVIAAALWLLAGRNCKVSFDPGCSAGVQAPDTQVIAKGETAAEPEEPFREDYVFLGWYTKNRPSRPFDFGTPIQRSIKLTAKWADPEDKEDSDGDGLPDSVEKQIGTDADEKDTDGERLSDYTEFVVLGLDPLSEDTDGDGVKDGKEDFDGDGMTNAEEEKNGTSPFFADTDADGLTDSEEVKKYKTSPLNKDTDGDGVGDGREVYIGTDPLKKEETFITVRESGAVSEEWPVSVEVSAETDAEGAGTLLITPLTSTNIPALTAACRGYLGTAYELYTEGNLSKAILTFRYDASLGELSDSFVPRVYYYDETENEFVELENQVAEDGKVTAETTHFSIYTLLNKALVDMAGRISAVQEIYSPDSNNDGISDYYTELIDKGMLLYDNTDLLTDVIGMFGADSDDWDGDGLKNGEEIKVVSDAHGNARIRIISNPVLTDSDFDGLSDFTEVKQTKTNPLKYDRRSLGALSSLENNSQYLYSLHENDWRDNIAGAVDYATSFFTYGKYDRAKDVLINYFYDYAPEETIKKNAELIEQQEAYEEALKVFGALSSVARAMKDTCSTFESGYKNAQLEEYYLESASCRRNVLNDINYRKVKGDTVSKELKLVTFPDKLQNAVDEILSGDNYRMISGGTEVISLASQALSAYNAACEFHIYSIAREVNAYVDNASALADLPKPPKASAGFSVACDIVEAGEDLLKVREMYGKLKANADAYNMYSELLVYIRDHAADENVSRAAADVARIVLDESGNEFFRQLTDACAKKLTAAGFKAALDVAAKESTVAKIAKGFLAAYQFTGVGTLVKYDVYFEVMTEISKGCIALLDSKINKNLETFAYAAEDSAWVEKYLVQLAQSRIMGEYYWYEYVADEGPVGWISSVRNGKKPSDYRKMFKDTAKAIYSCSNRLQLRLSDNLPNYRDYWSDQVPEDEIHIPGGKMIAANVAPTEEAVLSVYQRVLEEERTPILGYGMAQTVNRRVINFKDITGDGLPEMFYVSISEKSKEYFEVTDLHILSYHEGYISEIMNIEWNVAASASKQYVLFTRVGDHQLNAYCAWGDEWIERHFQTAEENELHTYEFFDIAYMSDHPDWVYDASTRQYGPKSNAEWFIGGASVSEEEYEAERASIEASMDEILMASMYGYRDRSTALTYMEAMDYLVEKIHPAVREQDLSQYIGRWHSNYPDDEMNAELTIADAGNGRVSFSWVIYRMYSAYGQAAWVNNENRASFYDFSTRCGDLYFEDNAIRLVVDKEVDSKAYSLSRYEYVLKRGISGCTFGINCREQNGLYYFYLDTDCPQDDSAVITWDYDIYPSGQEGAEDAWEVWEENGELVLNPKVRTWEKVLSIRMTYKNSVGEETCSRDFYFIEKQGTPIPALN